MGFPISFYKFADAVPTLRVGRFVALFQVRKYGATTTFLWINKEITSARQLFHFALGVFPMIASFYKGKEFVFSLSILGKTLPFTRVLPGAKSVLSI